VLFWAIVTTRYLVTAVTAFLLSIVVAFVTVLPFSLHDDGSPGLGILWFMVFLVEATVIVPLSLGATAELIERKVQNRKFRWSNAFTRFVMALPIAIGPLYAAICVNLYVENRRPTHWLMKEILLYCVSGLFAYFALRIKKQARIGGNRENVDSCVRQAL